MRKVTLGLALINIVLLSGYSHGLTIHTDDPIEREIITFMKNWEKRFNALDFEGLASMMHIPSYRLADGKLEVFEGQENSRRKDDTIAYLKKTGWHRTDYERVDFVHKFPRKVHISVQFARYREDDSLIGRWTSLYILTKLEGKWGMKFRSSWAPMTGD